MDMWQAHISNGETDLRKGDLVAAYKAGFQALSECTFGRRVAIAHQLMGQSVYEAGQYGRALLSYKVAMDFARQDHDEHLQGRILRDQALAYIHCNEPSRELSARAAINKSLQIFRRPEYVEDYALSLSALGEIELNMGQVEKAEACFHTAAKSLYSSDTKLENLVRWLQLPISLAKRLTYLPWLLRPLNRSLPASQLRLKEAFALVWRGPIGYEKLVAQRHQEYDDKL